MEENCVEEEKPKSPSLKKNILLNYIYQFLILVLPLITTPYLSRVLLVNGVGSKIGISSYTNSLVNIFIIFAALGTISYGTREIARKRDNKQEYSKLFFEIELLSVFASLITLLFWCVFATFYVEYRFYLYILSLNILATCFDISWLYAGLERYQYTVSINALFKIISTVLIFLLVNNPDHLWIYILISSSSLLLGNLSMWLFLPVVVKKEKVDFSNIKYHLKNSLKYFIPTIATTIYTILDKTLIGVLIPGFADEAKEIKISEIENGYYEQATKIITIVKTVCFFAINNVMYSRASSLYEKKDFDKIKVYLNKTLNLTLNLSIGSMFGLILVSSLFIPLYFGNGYEKSIIIIYILSIIVPIICISNTLGSIYYVPFGKRKQSSYYLMIGSAINLVLNIPLIIFLKSYGAAIASVIAELIIMIIYVKKSDNYLSFKKLFFILWKKVLAGLIMFGAVYGVKYLLLDYLNTTLFLQLTKLIILFFSGVMIYELMLLILKDQSIIDLKNKITKRGKRNE